ncbi:hypothetical protein Dsin_011871 [Dipteronia sinensis]|uniref:ABC transporter domain-containing protein n=1 Tax=Dipteronia sinensis TaxID=43782 RepID=A0AAE0AH03_9ROSI|nr:hypothetical protein Dsin_011871 [Dipteronia sinensis]
MVLLEASQALLASGAFFVIQVAKFCASFRAMWASWIPIRACKESGTSDNGAYLVWEDLTVVAQSLKNGATKKLVSGLSGYAEPDRIMAIMGPSGSGKSTFLDDLAGIICYAVYLTSSHYSSSH